MDYYEFKTRNLQALEQARTKSFESGEVGECNQSLRYRGFVNCCVAEGEGSFVMFNNADDVVAAHYLYVGPASFETETLRLWVHLARCAHWIFDVGAFTGVFSLAAATSNANCFVMAFEPSFTTYSRLLVNIRANAFDDRIAPVRCGLGSDNATHSLRHPSGVYVMSSDESFVASRVAEPWFSEAVPVLSLDHLLTHQQRYRTQTVLGVDFQSVDLIKIDVEGFELDVLRGMTEVIRRAKPIAIIEVFDLTEINDILEVFGKGYRAFYVDRLPYTPEGANVLIIHSDRLQNLDGYRRTPGSLDELPS